MMFSFLGIPGALALGGCQLFSAEIVRRHTSLPQPPRLLAHPNDLNNLDNLDVGSHRTSLINLLSSFGWYTPGGFYGQSDSCDASDLSGH